MTLEDYTIKLKETKERHKKEVNDLHVAYAKERRLFGIGDIIEEVGGKIVQVKSFGTNMNFSCDEPMPLYIGTLLTKQLTPKKHNSEGAIYGNTGVKLLKKAE